MNIIEINRIKKGLSQAELARKCNINQSFLSRIESRQKMPSAEIINILAKELKMCKMELYSYCSPCLDCEFLDSNGNCLYGKKCFTIT